MGERVAWFEALVLFHAFRLGLRVVPFRWFRALFGDPGPLDRPGERRPVGPPAAAAATVRRWLKRASRHLPDTCLAQALAGRVMLRRRGLASALSFGARDEDTAPARFHAWLVHDGHVLSGGAGLRRYTVIATYYDGGVPDPAPGPAP